MVESAGHLSLTQLATLLEFSRRRTLAAAGDALGYTPGAVSQHVSALERAVGVALVQRVGRQLRLTEAGYVLAQRAERILAEEREALRAVASLRGTIAGPFSVGTWGSTAAALLAPVVKSMSVSHPHLVICSKELDLDEAAAAVRHGTVDVAFGLDYEDSPLPRHSEVVIARVLEEEFSIAVAHDAGATSPAEARELSSFSWILAPVSTQYGRAMRAALRKRGVEPRVVHEVTDTAASLQLAAAGLGATVTTPLMRRLNPSVGIRPLRMRDPFTRQIVLLYSQEHRHAAVEPFHEAVTAAVARFAQIREPTEHGE